MTIVPAVMAMFITYPLVLLVCVRMSNSLSDTTASEPMPFQHCDCGHCNGNYWDCEYCAESGYDGGE